MTSILNPEELQTVLQSALFRGILPAEIEPMLPCLKAEKKSYEKGEFVFRYGDRISQTGLVLSGKVNAVRDDFWGKNHLVQTFRPGEVFGESYAAASREVASTSVAAAADSDILFLDIDKVLHMCPSSCNFHARLISNMVSILAERNLSLSEKLSHVTQHTLRDKLLSYLSTESVRHNSPYFDIPFDRQQLADYLNADRSALSNELSKMKKDGILDYQKNHFRLIHKPQEE